MSQPVPTSVFDALSGLSSKKYTAEIYPADAILKEDILWSEEDRSKPLSQRGAPLSIRWEVKEGVEPTSIEIQALTMAQRALAEAALDSAIAPKKYVEEAPDRPGMPVRRVDVGYDEEDPKYLAELRVAKLRQSAIVVIYGVTGLLSSLPEGLAAQIDKVQSSFSSQVIQYLASKIWGITYIVGDKADFFTSGSSQKLPS